MKLEKMGCNYASKRWNTNCFSVIKTLINAGLFGSSITENFPLLLPNLTIRSLCCEYFTEILKKFAHKTNFI